MADNVEKKIKDMSNFRKLILTSIVSALALVVGLFWNEAIKALIEQIVPKGDTLFFKFLAAFAATLFVAILIYAISKWMTVHREIHRRIRRRKGLL